MKILHITKGGTEGAAKAIIDSHAANHEVTVIDVKSDNDYARLVDLILTYDRVVTW